MGWLDTLLGNTAADASNNAARDTYAKQQAASSDLKAYGDTLPGQYADIASMYSPYTQAGNSSLSMLLNGLGLNGAEGSTAFTNAYRATPGYQAGLDSGTKAAITGANAGGILNSGRTMKTLQRFGQDYEDQKSGDYLTRLMGLQGQGLQATGAQANTMGQGLQGQLSTRTSAFGGDMNSAGTIGQGMVAGANAQQGALTNLLGAASYLGGAAMGGGGFGNLFGGGGSKSAWPTGGVKPYTASPWG